MPPPDPFFMPPPLSIFILVIVLPLLDDTCTSNKISFSGRAQQFFLFDSYTKRIAMMLFCVV